MRDDRSRRYTLTLLDDRLHVIRREHGERRMLCRPGHGMSVFPHIERAVGSLPSPVVADRLGNREDVRFGEGAVEGRATMAACTEDDHLVGIAQVRTAFEVLLLKECYIYEHFLRSRFACERRNYLA